MIGLQRKGWAESNKEKLTVIMFLIYTTKQLLGLELDL